MNLFVRCYNRIVGRQSVVSYFSPVAYHCKCGSTQKQCGQPRFDKALTDDYKKSFQNLPKVGEIPRGPALAYVSAEEHIQRQHTRQRNGKPSILQPYLLACAAVLGLSLSYARNSAGGLQQPFDTSENTASLIGIPFLHHFPQLLLVMFRHLKQSVLQCVTLLNGGIAFPEMNAACSNVLLTLRNAITQQLALYPGQTLKKAHSLIASPLLNWEFVKCDAFVFSPLLSSKIQTGASEPLTLKKSFDRFSVYVKQIAANAPIEDRFYVGEIPTGDGHAVLCAVIDGHSGWMSADYIRQMLALSISESVRQITLKTDAASSLRQAFDNLDSSLKEYLIENSEGNCPRSGACCVSVIIDEEKYYVANTGDCMAVLCTNGKALPLNLQHNADITVERERLLAAHPDEKDAVVCKRSWVAPKTPRSLKDYSLQMLGLLSNETLYAGCYVKNSLNVTRSFGDFHLKEEIYAYDTSSNRYRVRKPYSFPYITAMPEVTEMQCHEKDEFIIIASDGLWDFFSPDQAVAIVRDSISTSSEAAAEALINEVYNQASEKSGMPIPELLKKSGHFRRKFYDDLTVCIINLKR